MPEPSIAIVGSCNIDLVTCLARIPGPGETILGDRFAMGFGGKGANQAVMAGRLGAAASMIGALGDDLYADMTLLNFASEGIATDEIQRVAGPSGVAPIWVEPDGTNRIVVVPGANGLVEPAIAAHAIEGLSRVDVVVGQLEIPQLATTAAFEAARPRGARTILNPAPAAPLEASLLAATDWLVANEVELAALASGPIADDDVALVAFARSVRCRVAVTLGPMGVALVVDDGVVRLPAPSVVAIDTTGAGDAFVGAFAVGLAARLDPVAAASLANACAADSVTRPGTQASYPSRERAAALLADALAGARNTAEPAAPRPHERPTRPPRSRHRRRG